MRNNIQKYLLFAAFLLIFNCAANTFAQTEPPMPGGYAAIDVKDSAVVKAANFAVKAQSKKDKSKIKLVAVSKAEQQVVAGMNYSLCMQIEVSEKGRKTAVPQTVQTVVYQDLKDKLTLTSWAIAACAEAVPPVQPAKEN